MSVSTRREMAQMLDERMTRTYSSLFERQELEPDTSLVKTYLLEAHLPEAADGNEPGRLMRQVLTSEVLGRRILPNIHETKDESLTVVEYSLDRERVTAYIDSSNPRYWMLHSMSSSGALDDFVTRLASNSMEIDRAWLPADLLERVSGWGSFRGLNLDYDRRAVPDIDFESTAAPVEFLKMQLWGNKASEVLRILRVTGAFPHETTLAKVKVKYWLSDENTDDFSLDDVKFDGKVTARGTSFQSHIALISEIYRVYTEQIRKIENTYSLHAVVSEMGTRLYGQPVCYVLGRPILDLGAFCRNVFSASPPFRLWGVPIELSKNYYRVSALDLHVGSRLDFELTPDLIRVYLPKGSCGNTLLRLYVNLQHHYDALVRVEGANGEAVLEF